MMAFPAVIILAALFYVIISAVKIWYYGRMQIHYRYKLDPKILEEINRPPKDVREKIIKMQEERAKNFDDDPIRFYDKLKKQERGEKERNSEEKSFADSIEKLKKLKGRPLTIFEEMDLLSELKAPRKEERKHNLPKYDRNIFEDPLSRLYRDAQIEKKKQEAKLKQC